jgi:hypothetical protein
MNNGAVHRLVKETAVGITQAQYECFAQNNDFFAKHPKVGPWVARNWRYYIAEARATLARLLNGPMEERLKEQIADALIKDNLLRKGDTLKVQVSL